MSSGTSTQDTSSKSVNEIPQWMQQAGQKNYAYAEDVANRPLTQYQGQMVPDVAPQTQQFWDLAANAPNVGADQNAGATAGFFNSLGQTPQAVQSHTLAGTSLEPYMNPYTNDVINATLPIMQQQNALSQDQAGNAASAANAFGGSRMGVQQGVAQAQGAQNIGQMVAQLRNQNFAQAQAAATGDITRNQADQVTNQGAAQAKTNSDILASQGLSNQAQSMTGQNVANAGLLSSAGAGQSMQAQNEINAQMAKFNEARSYPQQQLSTLLAALGMTPHDTSTTGESDTKTTTPTDWASILTGGLGIAGDIFKSDKRVKKNITSLGKDPTTGVPVKAFNYKGQAPGSPKILGPLAQDVEKAMPGSTATVRGVMAAPGSTLARVTPSVAASPAFVTNSGAKVATTKVGAGARAFGGLANTKRKMSVKGVLAGA